MNLHSKPASKYLMKLDQHKSKGNTQWRPSELKSSSATLRLWDFLEKGASGNTKSTAEVLQNHPVSQVPEKNAWNA